MVSECCLVIRLVAPAPATLDYGNRTVVNFQRVPGYPFEINTCTRVAVYHISDTPTCQHPHSTLTLMQSGIGVGYCSRQLAQISDGTSSHTQCIKKVK